MSFLKKGKKIWVGILDQNLSEIKVVKLPYAENLAETEFGDQKFAIHEKPLDLIWGRKIIRVHLVDEAAGGSAKIQRGIDEQGNSAIDVRFDGWEIAKCVDNTIIGKAWQPEESKRAIAIGFLLGVGLTVAFFLLI